MNEPQPNQRRRDGLGNHSEPFKGGFKYAANSGTGPEGDGGLLWDNRHRRDADICWLYSTNGTFHSNPKKNCVAWLSIFPVVKTNGGRGTFGMGWICASHVQEPFDYGSMAALRRQHQGCPTQLGARTHSDAFSFLSGTTMPRRTDAA